MDKKWLKLIGLTGCAMLMASSIRHYRTSVRKRRRESAPGQVLFIIDQVPYKAALRTATADVAAARANLKTAELNFNSSKELYAQKVISQVNLEIVSEVGISPLSVSLPARDNKQLRRRQGCQNLLGAVTASWEIDIFGKLRNAKRQSQALYAQSQDYRQAVRTQVIAGIANTYYTLLMLDAQLEISEQTKISWKESADATRALMNAGRADNSAVSQMEAAYYSVCASVLDLKEQINQVENSMSLLLASTPHTIERGKLDTLNIPTSFSTGIPVQLLSNRPDVRAAKRSLEQAFYAANQARSAFYPSITLSGSAGGQIRQGVRLSIPESSSPRR